MKERNINLDLIRVVAIVSVICVHFIRNIGFYGVDINSVPLIISVFIRTFFMICVPLFLLLTGYLMNKKTLSKKYYKGVIRIIYIYLVYKIFYLLFNIFYLKNVNNFISIFKIFFDFENDYSWYVNMYLGLFLIIPFLNLIYNNLCKKKEKQILILTLFFLTSIATLSLKKIVIIPNWWSGIYPITYYFIGAYISEYGFNLKKSSSLIVLLLSWLIPSGIYAFFSYNTNFCYHALNEYNGPLNFVLSVVVFGLLLNLNTKKITQSTRKIILNISKLSFGMYLFSYIVDKFVYDKLNSLVLNINDRFLFFPLITVIVFFITYILSYLCELSYEKIVKSRIEKAS